MRSFLLCLLALSLAAPASALQADPPPSGYSCTAKDATNPWCVSATVTHDGPACETNSSPYHCTIVYHITIQIPVQSPVGIPNYYGHFQGYLEAGIYAGNAGGSELYSNFWLDGSGLSFTVDLRGDLFYDPAAPWSTSLHVTLCANSSNDPSCTSWADAPVLFPIPPGVDASEWAQVEARDAFPEAGVPVGVGVGAT